MKFLEANRASIAYAADIIKKQGLVAFPTETVYGLGADALDPVAVAKIFEAKQRPFFDPLIVHVADNAMLEKVVASIPPQVQDLLDAFWPGALTVVLEKQEIVPDIISAGLPTVAVRMPSNPVARQLIQQANTPIAAPSANPFGYLSPTIAEHVREQLGNRIDVILDGGPCQIGVESTIVRVIDNTPYLLRSGGISVEELERVVGQMHSSYAHDAVPDAPGQLISHYAPHAKVQIIVEGAEIPEKKGRIGLLAFRSNNRPNIFTHVEVLSATGDLREAAARLFHLLHILDTYTLDTLYVEAVPEKGLGITIMNRLQKAAAEKN
jgi:L-threonylcarbamoyladenylate synthase